MRESILEERKTSAAQRNNQACADTLAPGDTVRTLAGLARVETVAAEARHQRVHNLSIADARTFLVGDGGAWVHNCDVNRININSKIADQMVERGWTEDSILALINGPYTTRKSHNSKTGNQATVYYRKDGHHVIRENDTGLIVQITDSRRDPKTWRPDSRIQDPYKPD